MRPSLAIVLVLLLWAAPASGGGNDLFDELARGVDSRSPAAVLAAHRVLLAADGHYLERPMRAGRLRVALARRLGDTEVDVLLARARKADDSEALLALVSNLSPRRDLAARLASSGLWQRLLDEEGGRDVLLPLARDAVCAGATELAAALLDDARSVVPMADALSQSRDPAGLRLLADAVTGRVPLSPESRTRLAVFEPDIGNVYAERPLDVERAEALAAVAGTDPDFAMRVLAARILLRSSDPRVFGALVSAYEGASSWRIEREEWRRIGRGAGSEEVFDDRLSTPAWIAAWWGRIYLSHVRASDDVASAEVLARSVAGQWRGLADARRAGSLLRLLEQFSYVFVDRSAGVARPVPAWRRLVAELAEECEGRPADLAALAGRVASRLRGEWESEATRREAGAPRSKPETHASPVWDRLPPAFAREAGCSADDVRAWIALDPLHLFDPAVNARFRSWSKALRTRVLDLYPRGRLVAWLATPPDRYRLPGKARFARDAVGAENRERLLRLLGDTAIHRVLSPGTVDIGPWPARNRFFLGRLLHAGRGDASLAAPSSPLTDDAVAAGFAAATIASPRGEEDLAFAARLVTGALGRPGALAQLADSYEYGPPEDLGPRGDEAPGRGIALAADLRAALGTTLRAAADPYVAWLAARILVHGHAPEDLAVLLTPAGDALQAGVVRSSHPLADLALFVRTPAHLEVGLHFFEDARVSPRARVAYLDALLGGDLFDEYLDPEDLPTEADALRARVLGWLASTAPRLDGDVPEGLLLSLAEHLEGPAQDLRFALDALRRGVEGVPAPGVRLRLRPRVEELEAWARADEE